ncbi:hypothetical protein D3C77_515860 [compost metagenome]
MRLPTRYAPVLFAALLSAIMTCVVSAAVLVLNQGWTMDVLHAWPKSAFSTWLIGFPTVLLVAPLVRRVVLKLTQ